jgi:hypothetical protein
MGMNTVRSSSTCIFDQFAKDCKWKVAKPSSFWGPAARLPGSRTLVGAHVGYRPAQLDVAQLLQAVPDLERVAKAPLQAEQVAQLDSKDMDHTTWHALAVRCSQLLERADVGGIVITHGTDTLEETAWFLQCAAASQTRGADLCHASGQCHFGRWAWQSAGCGDLHSRCPCGRARRAGRDGRAGVQCPPGAQGASLPGGRI